MEPLDHHSCRRLAEQAARTIRTELKISDAELPRIAFALGSGWDKTLRLEDERLLPFQEVSPIFGSLKPLKGHARKVAYGFSRLADGRRVPVVALRGRVHLNAKPFPDPETVLQVRLQTEMLFELGVLRLITTCAAGGIPDNVKKNDMVAIDGFFDVLVRMPLFGHEFVTTDTAIDVDLLRSWMDWAREAYETDGRKIHTGGHAIIPGPNVEGTRYGKPFFKFIPGVQSIGMGSVAADAAVACLYKDARVLPVSFITDGNDEVCLHEENVAAVEDLAPVLNDFLRTGVEVTAHALD